MRDPVTGEQIDHDTTCREARAFMGACGPDGKLFEARPPTPAGLKKVIKIR